MHERDLEPEHAAARTGVDQLDTLSREIDERRLDIVDGVGDVMHAGSALREELADGRVGTERCEQLDSALAETHRCRLDALLVDALAMLEPAAEQPLVRRHRRIEVLDGDPDVMDGPCFHPGDATAASAMLAAMGRRSVFAAILLAVLVAGCGGGGSGNGEAKKPAAQVVADAQAAAAKATLVHVVGAGKDNGQPLKLDIWMGRGKGKGHLEENGAGFDVVRVGETIYVKGSDAFLKQFAGAAAATLFHGRWLKGSASSAQLGALAPLTDISSFFKGVLGQHGKIVNKGESTRDGDHVVEIHDTTEGGSLFVAAEGDPFPVAVTGGAAQGDITFSDWNGSESIVAPKDAVDLAELGK